MTLTRPALGCRCANWCAVRLLIFPPPPDYLDTASLPAVGASALWKYKAIYRLNDIPVGLWSDVVSIAVNG